MAGANNISQTGALLKEGELVGEADENRRAEARRTGAKIATGENWRASNWDSDNLAKLHAYRERSRIQASVPPHQPSRNPGRSVAGSAY